MKTLQPMPAALLAIAFLALQAAPARAQSVGGSIVFSGTDQTFRGTTSGETDPATGVSDTASDAQTLNSNFRRNTNYSGYRDNATGTWVGAQPGVLVERTGHPGDSDQYAGASDRFRAAQYEGTSGGSPGVSRAGVSIDGGHSGADSTAMTITSATATSHWSDNVTFGGHQGFGTAHVVIQLDGLIGTGTDLASSNVASVDYVFTATSFTPDALYGNYGPLTQSMYLSSTWRTVGGAAATEPFSYDVCGAYWYSYPAGSCAGAFSTVLEGDIAFQYGAPITFGARLTASAQGEAWADATDTARVMLISVPEGTTFSYASAVAGNPLNIAAVPEPGTYAMLGAGLALIGVMRQRSRSPRC